MQKIFDDVKDQLVNSIMDGLTRFEVNRHTALVTDWSKAGVGYILTQKSCECSDINPMCCKYGWKVCLLGSRFTIKAEANYAPVEDEMLAVTYGLSKTKYYTLGLEKLIICVDHKLLLRILNDCPLEKIDNRRLSRLNEKIFGWRYKIVHISGSRLTGPDALSRMPRTDAEAQLIQANKTMYHHFETE